MTRSDDLQGLAGRRGFILRGRGAVIAALLVGALALAGGALSPAGAAAAESAFPIRGVIYGPFGSIWNHAERMDMVRWLAAHRMNTFVYMPIEDVFTRERWRDSFPEDAMGEFAEEIRLARSLGLRWGVGIRPGQPLFVDDPHRDICFSCDEDFELLAAKYKRFHDLGVRLLMLSFDDVVKASTHPEDAERFGVGDASYGRMNAHLANRLQERFSDSLLIFGPADYSGTSRTEYLTALAENLSPRIVVYWTGPQIGSRTITAADAEAYSDAISPEGGPRRRPLIWDNYPTNDLYGEAYSAPSIARESAPRTLQRPPSLRLNFGPLKHRGADLVGRVEGSISNGMNQPHASKVALYTVAAYLNDPSAYTADQVVCPENPDEHTRSGCLAERAWIEGARELGGAFAEDLLNVVNQMRSTKFDRTEAPVFVARRDALVQSFRKPGWELAWSALVRELLAERDAGRALRASKRPSPEFVEEAGNHLDTLELNTAAGLLAAEMLKAQRPTFDAVSVDRHGLTVVAAGRALPADPLAVGRRQIELAPVESSMRSSPFSVHGDRADAIEAVFSGSMFLLENRVDQFLDWAHETTSSWLPLSTVAAEGPLRVTVNGVPVKVEGDGSFSTGTALAPGQKAVELVVTDAVGFATARTYALRQ